MINLRGTDRKVFSQNGEDGILEKILETIGTTNRFFVEFGVDNAEECNTRLLKQLGWSGIWMDSNSRGTNGVNLELVTAENINYLLHKYSVPHEFDVLSIDVDGNDYWIWKAIDHHPRVVIIEWNCSITPFRAFVAPYDPVHVWDETAFYGASILALTKLGESKGFTLVASDRRATNLFFVRNDYAKLFEGAGNIESIYPDWHWSHAEDHQQRKFIEV